MDYTFDSEIKRYISHIDSIEDTMPLIMLTLGTIGKKSKKDFKELIANFEVETDKEGNELVKIPIGELRRYNKLKARVENFSLAGSVIPRSLLVSLVSIYDAYLGRLLRTMFLVKPEILNALQKNITLSELLTYNSIDEAKEFMIEKEIETVLRDSHSEQFEWLEKKLDMTLRKGLASWPTFIEITERRNLYVHCDGVISSQYLSVCNRNKVVHEKEIKVGDDLNVSGKYFKTALNCMYEIGIKLGQVIWRKLKPDEIEAADKNINEIVYDIIVNESYDIAINILEFAVEVLKKNVNDEYKYFFVVNLAQSYKWKGDSKKCIEILGNVNWAPLSDSFRLANAVLSDNFTEAIFFMRRIGTRGVVSKFNYCEWPLFNEFRKSQEFAAVYNEIFGEVFEITEVASEPENEITRPDEEKSIS